MTCIGIDLGTTNSLAAVWKNQKIELIPNALGELMTPSVVSLSDKEEIIIGQAAKDRLTTHSSHSIACFKRLMGTNSKVMLGKKMFVPEELSSLILRQLKEDAEIYLGETVEEAIISVPAYFNDNQRNATRIAAQLAGLKVDRLINEPTAAALAYGVNNQADEQTYIIIDLGGGTFDVSILEKFDNIMEVHASAGDSFLGGEDFTERLVKEFCKEKSLDYEKLSQKDKSQLYYQFDRLKQHLSKEKKVEANFQVNEQNHSYNLDHDKFNKQVKPLLQKLLAPIENSIRDANIRIQDIDDIFIVGGATRMPIIRQFIARLFGRLPSCHINPDEVVVMGAAIQAALKERNEDFDDIVLTDVCPFSMGVETSTDTENGSVVSGLYSIILERNHVIPVSRTERFFTMRDNQNRIDVNIFQGEQRLTDNNIKLGNISINVPIKKRGEESIDVRFTYDINGLLEVVVTVTSTKEKKHLIINNSQNRLTDKEIKQALKKLDHLKIHPREKSVNQALLSRAERIYQQSLGHERDQIGRLLLQFETVLDSQDERKIKKAVSEFIQALDTLDNNLWS